MRHGSLFSGIGGFDLASEWMGWENVFHCEINEFCQRVLKYYWPNAKSYSDIKTTDFSIWRGKVDIISGGFPCQPYSQAGKRKGTSDDRHLWPEMLRAIREIQPRFVVGENVPGLLNWGKGMVLDEIKADLEASGFEVFPPLVLPACGKNAPHRRDRLWIVANRKVDGCTLRKAIDKREEHKFDNGNSVRSFFDSNGEVGITPNTKGNGNRRDLRELEEPDEEQQARKEPGQGESSAGCIDGNATNSNSNGQQRSDSKHEINASKRRFDALNDIEQIIATNSTIKRLERGKRRTPKGERFAINSWEEFPTQSPICSGDDGLPTDLDGVTISKHRTESIKGYGNAIVPQVVLEIFKCIEMLSSDKNDERSVATEAK